MTQQVSIPSINDVRKEVKKQVDSKTQYLEDQFNKLKVELNDKIDALDKILIAWRNKQ